MPPAPEVKATAMGGVELPPHPERTRARRGTNPDKTETAKRFTNTPSDKRKVNCLPLHPKGIMLQRDGYLKLLRYLFWMAIVHVLWHEPRMPREVTLIGTCQLGQSVGSLWRQRPIAVV